MHATITINTWQALAALFFVCAIGSFIGCYVFIKLFDWASVTVKTKIELSKIEMKKAIERVLNAESKRTEL